MSNARRTGPSPGAHRGGPGEDPSAAPLTLYLLPFAGGSVYSYRPLEEQAGPEVRLVPLELPGRGRRMEEPFLNSLEEAVDDICRQLRSHLRSHARGGYALFGHSMGAILAYRAALRLMEEEAPLPSQLFLSGHRAPTCAQRSPLKHALPREKLVGELRKLQGVPDTLLDDPDAMDFFEPVLRSDFRMIENYHQSRPKPVSMPLHLFMGREDDITETEKRAWESHTSADFSMTEFNGSHFFIYEYKIQLMSIIYSLLINN